MIAWVWLRKHGMHYWDVVKLCANIGSGSRSSQCDSCMKQMSHAGVINVAHHQEFPRMHAIACNKFGTLPVYSGSH